MHDHTATCAEGRQRVVDVSLDLGVAMITIDEDEVERVAPRTRDGKEVIAGHAMSPARAGIDAHLGLARHPRKTLVLLAADLEETPVAAFFDQEVDDPDAVHGLPHSRARRL